MIKSHSRGNPIYYDGKDWRYEDGSINDDSRPCARCGRLPTKEGHDACTGYIKGFTSVCCGHGVEKGYRR